MGITLEKFIEESNEIEGIRLHPHDTDFEAQAALEFILNPEILSLKDLVTYVDFIEHGACLRNKPGMDVIVGNHTPPKGGPLVENFLTSTLRNVNLDYIPEHSRGLWAYKIHVKYETLHPFMDGNGRSGRMLWLRMMRGVDWLKSQPFDKNVFLHHWYYQSLGGGTMSEQSSARARLRAGKAVEYNQQDIDDFLAILPKIELLYHENPTEFYYRDHMEDASDFFGTIQRLRDLLKEAREWINEGLRSDLITRINDSVGEEE